MYWAKALLLSCLITIVRSMYIDIDRKKNFCPPVVAIELSKYCEIFNGSADNHRSGYYAEDDRESSKVVGLCCHKACSIRELLEGFCEIIKPEFKHLFEPNKTNQERTNTIISEKSKEERDSREISIAPKKVVSTRPSRCNNRRNANRKVRRVRVDSTSTNSSLTSSPKTKSKSKYNRCRCCKRLRKKKILTQMEKPQRPYKAPIIGYENDPTNQVIYVNKPNV